MKGCTTKKLIFVTVLICLLVAFCGIFSGCQSNEGKQFQSFKYFNTETTLVLFGNTVGKEKVKAENVWEQVKEMLSDIENAISFDKEGSDIDKFNSSSGGQLEIREHTYNILLQAKDLYYFTQGAFNPALGWYVDLWGFSPRFSKIDYKATKDFDRADYKNSLPSAEYIEGFAPLTDFSKVTLSYTDGKYYIIKPSDSVVIKEQTYTMAINLGGIGKGYATDVITDYLKKAGITSGYISVGRSSLTVLNNAITLAGAPKDTDWKVGLINPHNTAMQYGDLYLSNISLSSSGGYENYYEIDGTRYSHIIDADTFYPINNTVTSVTVVNNSATFCDALSTAFCVMGIENSKAFIADKMEGSQVIISYQKGAHKEVFLGGGSDNFVLTDSDFALKLSEVQP